MFLVPFEKVGNDVGEGDGALVVMVKDIFHFLKFLFSGTMSQSSDKDGELGGGDGAIIFFIEDGEEFLIIYKFLFAESLNSHWFYHLFSIIKRI